MILMRHSGRNKTKCINPQLKVRGIYETETFAFAMGISINFGRIARFMSSIELSSHKSHG
jgi:hypothetical protein